MACRTSLIDEFSTVSTASTFVATRRGVQGDVSRREGGKIFGGGSRAPVAITILVKERGSTGPAILRYHDIGDYLSREDKLQRLVAFGDCTGVPWEQIKPNADGDWIRQRDAGFAKLLALGNKGKEREPAVFATYGHGLSTSRDAWVYNFDRNALLANVTRMAGNYNEQRIAFADHAKGHPDSKSSDLVDDFIDVDPHNISWSRALKQRLARGAASIEIDAEHVVSGAYRPFCKQYVYMDTDLNEVMSLQPRFFPPQGPPNLAIVVTGPGARREFSALMVDAVPNLHHQDSGQAFPRFAIEPLDDQGSLLTAENDGWKRVDNISAGAVTAFREHYEDQSITADDVFYYVYGALHSPAFRRTHADDLRRTLARIPMLADFHAYSGTGREFADLHVNYKTVAPFAATEETSSILDPEARYRVEKLRFATKNDRTAIIVNAHLTISGIPERAYEYEVNGRSAIEWVMDRYQVRVDKDSGITNDPNDYSDDPRYVIDLLLRVVTVSLETLDRVDRLLRLEVDA